MKKNKISKNWIRKKHKDQFFKKSKIYGYRSRSAFKLIEINEKYKFLNKDSYILDLGCSPGGWSQVLSKKLFKGKILSLDIKPMEPIDNVKFLNCDLNDQFIYEKIFSYFGRKIDAVISDMAANTTGNKNLDSFNTGELCLKSMNLAKKILNDEGVFLSKIFMGSIFDEINKNANKYFKKVIKYKPIASRKESKEIYIYCKGILKV